MATKNNQIRPNYENYTPEEQAEAYIFPTNLTPEERAKMDAECRILRMQMLEAMAPEEKIRGYLLGLKFRIEGYVKQSAYNQSFAFSACLKEYLKIVHKKQNVFASEIQVSPAKLRLLLADRLNPTTSLAYRLEKHSGQLIPALLWWKLVAKKIEFEIQNDVENRKVEK